MVGADTRDRFAIPFTLATTLGLAAVALTGDPDMRELSPGDVSAGLPAAAAAAALLGKGGAAALLILLFLAVTSACSAELIAVSSLLTYDVYKVRLFFIYFSRMLLNVGFLEIY
jgi:Na+/proline symporter